MFCVENIAWAPETDSGGTNREEGEVPSIPLRNLRELLGSVCDELRHGSRVCPLRWVGAEQARVMHKTHVVRVRVAVKLAWVWTKDHDSGHNIPIVSHKILCLAGDVWPLGIADVKHNDALRASALDWLAQRRAGAWTSAARGSRAGGGVDKI